MKVGDWIKFTGSMYKIVDIDEYQRYTWECVYSPSAKPGDIVKTDETFRPERYSRIATNEDIAWAIAKRITG